MAGPRNAVARRPVRSVTTSVFNQCRGVKLMIVVVGGAKLTIFNNWAPLVVGWHALGEHTGAL